jgi:hypothetical protein
MMKLFIWVLKEAGACNVPSFDQLRKTQNRIRGDGGIKTLEFKSAKGNIFHMLDPRPILANVCEISLIRSNEIDSYHWLLQDYATLKTRELLHFYPEVPSGPISEFWHLSKLHFGFELDMLTPMYVSGSQHFYVKEFNEIIGGRLVIPMRWIVKDGVLCADAFEVILDSEVSFQ